MRAFDLAFPAARRRCRVRVGAGALVRLTEELAEAWPRRLFVVVTDDRVGPLHAEPCAARLRGQGLRAELIVFPAGEASKSWETAGRLAERLCAIGADRETVCVAVGGGVTGDVAGFLASIWQRGVPVVHVPTSLLAMVDASIGGKTAVNLTLGKNLVGTFHQPWGVYLDPGLLETLAPADYANGLAEVVKSAAVADLSFFRWLESAARALVGRDPQAVEETVVRSVEIKARIVERDEREAGRRAALNFGHTLAHAAEAASDYRLPHGAAVAAGICLEARIAARVTGFPRNHVQRIHALTRALGLPQRFPASIGTEALIALTRRDKKVRDGQVRYAFPRSLGRMPKGGEVTVPVADELVRSVLDEEPPSTA